MESNKITEKTSTSLVKIDFLFSDSTPKLDDVSVVSALDS